MALIERPPGLPGEAEILGRAGKENFTVASRLLDPASRRHLLAFYGWARLVDQLGDAYPGDRLAALDWAEAELAASLGDSEGPGHHPLVAAAARSVLELGTGRDELLALVEANRRDQSATRYLTFDDLLGYCRLSANPVGRLVLAAFDASSPLKDAWSDAICSGLQVVEHLQDVAEDTRAGRTYLPAEDLDRFGVTPGDLDAAARSGPLPGRRPAALRAVIAHEAWRAASLIESGRPLVVTLSGRSRVAVAGFMAGGLAAIDAIAAGGFDPWSATPTAAPGKLARHSAGVLLSVRHRSRRRSR